MFTFIAGAGFPAAARRFPSRRLLAGGLAACALLAVPAVAAAADVHVAPAGADSDGCGTLAKPCLTVTYAAGRAEWGDTLRLAAGDYAIDTTVDLKRSLAVVGAGRGQTVIRTRDFGGEAMFESGNEGPTQTSISDVSLIAPTDSSGWPYSWEPEYRAIASYGDDELTVRRVDLQVANLPVTGIYSRASAALVVDEFAMRRVGASGPYGAPGVLRDGPDGPTTVTNSVFDLGLQFPMESERDGFDAAAVAVLGGSAPLTVTGSRINAPAGVIHLFWPFAYDWETEEEVPTFTDEPFTQIAGNRITTGDALGGGVVAYSVPYRAELAARAEGDAEIGALVKVDANVIDTQPTAAERSGDAVGIAVAGPLVDALVTRNSISRYTIGIAELPFLRNVPRVRVNGNRIAGNEIGLAVSSPERPELDLAAAEVETRVDARDNWWGCNAGPGAEGCDTVEVDPAVFDGEPEERAGRALAPSGLRLTAPAGRRDGRALDPEVGAVATYTPHLVFGLGATPSAPAVGADAALRADVTRNSAGATVAGTFASIDASPAVRFFGATGGTLPAGAEAAPLVAGVATSAFTATAATGRSVQAQLDNQTERFAFGDVVAEPEPPQPGPAQVPLSVTPVTPAGAPTSDELRVLAYRDMLQCRKVPITVFDVSRQDGRVVVTGVTFAGSAGKTVRLAFKPGGGKVVARGTVAEDGSFTVSAPLPAKRWRSGASDEARYRASVSGVGATPWLKLTRRLSVRTFALQGRTLRVAGKLAGPLAKGREIVVSTRVKCGAPQVAARIKPEADGAYEAQVAIPAGVTAATVRLRSVVKGKHGGVHRTYTLTKPVLLLP